MSFGMDSCISVSITSMHKAILMQVKTNDQYIKQFALLQEVLQTNSTDK